jgi:uncharacterized protein YraI
MTPATTTTLEVTSTPLPEGALNAVVTSKGLNVRTGPGPEFAKLGAVGNGTELVLIGRNSDGSWVRGTAEEEGLEGWLSVFFMRVDGDVRSLPVLDAVTDRELEATPERPAAGKVTAVVASRGLNIRTGPGIQYVRAGAVAGGTNITLIGRNGDGSWVLGRAEEEDLEGWLSVPYLDIVGDILSLPVIDPATGLELQPTPTQPPATATPIIVPEQLPNTGALGSIPLWGLLALASAALLALSHLVRWARNETMS